MVDLIFDEYPWMKHLPPGARDEFAADATATLRAATDLDNWSIFTRLINDWRATAEIYADPVLFRALAKPHRFDGPLLPFVGKTVWWMISTCGGRRLRLGRIF